jgi:hypothetical protein
MSLTLSQYLYFGTGSPETVVTAPVGSIYLRLNGGAGTVLYLKETGTGNTGWVAYNGAGSTTISNLSADASGSLACTTTMADIPGATITLTQTGKYLIFGDFHVGTPVNSGFIGQLIVNGVAQAGLVKAAVATVTATDQIEVSVSRSWIYNNSGSNVAKLQGAKSAAGGATTVFITDTGIRAIFLG